MNFKKIKSKYNDFQYSIYALESLSNHRIKIGIISYLETSIFLKFYQEN